MIEAEAISASLLQGGLGLQPQEFRTDALFVTMQYGQCAFHTEAGLAGVAGIEEKNAVDVLLKWLVGMAEDDHIRFFPSDASPGRIAQILRMDYMMDKELAACQFNHLSQVVIEPGIICVPRNCSYGRDLLEL